MTRNSVRRKFNNDSVNISKSVILRCCTKCFVVMCQTEHHHITYPQNVLVVGDVSGIIRQKRKKFSENAIDK